jgi:hypothetical protein
VVYVGFARSIAGHDRWEINLWTKFGRLTREAVFIFVVLLFDLDACGVVTKAICVGLPCQGLTTLRLGLRPPHVESLNVLSEIY